MCVLIKFKTRAGNCVSRSSLRNRHGHSGTVVRTLSVAPVPKRETQFPARARAEKTCNQTVLN